MLVRCGCFIFVWGSLGSGECNSLFTELVIGWEPTANEGPNSVCCINQSGCLTPAVSTPDLILEAQYFSSAGQQRPGVWEESWEQISQTLLNNVLRAAGKARLAVSYTLYLLPSVYSWLYWFSFGKSLPWLPSIPLLLIHPGECSSLYCITTLALEPNMSERPCPGAYSCQWDRRQDCVDHLLVASSWPALGKEQGLFTWSLQVLTGCLKC